MLCYGFIFATYCTQYSAARHIGSLPCDLTRAAGATTAWHGVAASAASRTRHPPTSNPITKAATAGWRTSEAGYGT